jgi:hypothetical protein
MGDYAPVYTGGAKPFTLTTSGAVTGGQVLVHSGADTVAASGGTASAIVVGVAAHDAPSGGKVTIWPLEGVIHELLASEAIAAGAGVESDTAGTVATVATSIATGAAAGTLIGIAMAAAAGSPLKVRVQGRR